MARPLIAVTGPELGGTGMWLFTWLAVYLAGGWAVRLTPGSPTFSERLGPMEGLILTGGADVAPSLYEGEDEDVLKAIDESEPQRTHYLIGLVLYPLLTLLRRLLARRPDEGPYAGLDADRDNLELGLLHTAMEQGLPILGICRGMQLINVAYGGSLYKDLTELYTEHPQIRSLLPRKHVEIAPDSRLADILGARSATVNALHNQAVRDLGSHLRVCAREPSGVVQAIEHESRTYVIGVQWHPEFLPQKVTMRRLFRGLVDAARARR